MRPAAGNRVCKPLMVWILPMHFQIKKNHNNEHKETKAKGWNAENREDNPLKQAETTKRQTGKDCGSVFWDTGVIPIAEARGCI